LPQFFSELIGDLRDEVWRLKGTTNVAMPAPTEDDFAMPAPTEDQGRREAIVLSLQDQLREKNVEIAGMRSKYQNLVFVFSVFVIGLVSGKLLWQ
jgi:hypothetical protein